MGEVIREEIKRLEEGGEDISARELQERYGAILARSALVNEQNELGFKIRDTQSIGPDEERDRKSTRLNSSHTDISRMPSSA